MKNLIKEFDNNHNVGLGKLRVAGPYRVKVFNGCGSNYQIVDELEKNTVIYIDRIAPSENSHSTFGHIDSIARTDGTFQSWFQVNRWISLASNNLVPESFTREGQKFSYSNDENFNW